jgi:hypothetical protein
MEKHPRRSREFRGSRRRLRGIRFRDHWSAGMSWLTLGMLIVLFLVVPWLIRASNTTPEDAPHSRSEPTISPK